MNTDPQSFIKIFEAFSGVDQLLIDFRLSFDGISEKYIFMITFDNIDRNTMIILTFV
jgi:hypothetical protein